VKKNSIRYFAKTLLLRPVVFGTLSLGLLAAPPKHSAPMAGATQAKAVDPAELLKFPESFSGVILEATSKERVLGGFRGSEWTKAPGQWVGSSMPGARFSGKAPILRASMGFTDRNAMALSFNLGVKNGKGYFRAFKWDGDLGPADTVLAHVEDEGEMTTLEDGTIQLLGSQFRFLLRRKAAEAAWEPTKVALFRFEGKDVGTMLKPTPGRPHGNAMYPTQFVPSWIVGSYMYLSDSRFGRLYFRIFGTEQIAVWPTVLVDGKMKLGSPSYIYGRAIESNGREDLQGLFGQGIAFDRTSGGRPATAYGIGSNSEMVISMLKVLAENGERGLTTIEGSSVPIAISEADAKEILSRASDNGWVLSPGSYSLGRQLLNAFRGIALVAPVPVYWNDKESVPGVERDGQTRTAYAEKCSVWKADIESVGGTLRIPEATGEMITSLPAPFGHLAK
jgi:hypothetical protein